MNIIKKTAFHICVLVPEKNPHAACFHETSLLLYNSLTSLGFASDIAVNKLDSKKINIILGSNLLSTTKIPSGYKYIVYQLEQLNDKEGWYTESMHSLLSQAEAVWDYSLFNIEFLKSRNIHALHLPPGYHPSLELINHSTNPDIDILFFGSINERRKELLNQILADHRYRLQVVYGVYGKVRDALIARSKIVLNIHFYSMSIFESVRVSFLLNNRCCVVSELSPDYPYPKVSLPLVPFEEILNTCSYLLLHDNEREAIRQSLHDSFKESYPMDLQLSRVLQHLLTRDSP